VLGRTPIAGGRVASVHATDRISHYLKKLRDAGIVDSERKGLWTYYYVIPDALAELSAWLR
jgi:predicted transcriptional regulator